MFFIKLSYQRKVESGSVSMQMVQGRNEGALETNTLLKELNLERDNIGDGGEYLMEGDIYFEMSCFQIHFLWETVTLQLRSHDSM